MTGPEDCTMRTLTCEALPPAARAEAERGAASSIVLFGSRAVGLGGPSADWDLLFVSSSPRPRARLASIDIVWVLEDDLRDRRWLGSELAGHIARYGVWISGDPSWATQTFVSEAAIETKVRQIHSRLGGLVGTWSKLSRPYRQKHQTLTRLNLQRLDVLLKGGQVPPRPLLERSWAAHHDPLAEIERLLEVLSDLPPARRRERAAPGFGSLAIAKTVLVGADSRLKADQATSTTRR